MQAQFVQQDSPAARAGLMPGDLLLEIDGTPVSNAEEIFRLLPKPGTTVQLRLVRPGPGGAMGRSFTLPLTTEEKPSLPAQHQRVRR